MNEGHESTESCNFDYIYTLLSLPGAPLERVKLIKLWCAVLKCEYIQKNMCILQPPLKQVICHCSYIVSDFVWCNMIWLHMIDHHKTVNREAPRVRLSSYIRSYLSLRKHCISFTILHPDACWSSEQVITRNRDLPGAGLRFEGCASEGASSNESYTLLRRALVLCMFFAFLCYQPRWKPSIILSIFASTSITRHCDGARLPHFMVGIVFMTGGSACIGEGMKMTCQSTLAYMWPF